MMIKKTGSFLLRYILILFIAGLATGLLSLILKVSRVTVQGPTTFSTLSGIITYYMAVSMASFFLFKMGRREQHPFTSMEGTLFVSIIFITQMVLLFTGYWRLDWWFANGSLSLANYLYTGGGYLESFRYIPSSYLFSGLALENLCVFVFSQLGLRQRMSPQK